MHLGEGSPAAAPGLALPDSPVLYGGVVHWAKAPHLRSAVHYVSWQMVCRSSCVKAFGQYVIMCHGKWSTGHHVSCVMVSGQLVLMCHGIWLAGVHVSHGMWSSCVIEKSSEVIMCHGKWSAGNGMCHGIWSTGHHVSWYAVSTSS